MDTIRVDERQIFPKAKADLEQGIAKDCEVLFLINKQSHDNAGSMHVGKDDSDDDAYLRHADDETGNAVLLTGLMATRLEKNL